MNSNNLASETRVFISGREIKKFYSIVIHVLCTPNTQICDIFNQNVHKLRKPIILAIHRDAHLNWCKYQKLEECHIHKKDLSNEDICTICFQQIKNKPNTDIFVRLPDCNHIFCASCIEQWMIKHKGNTCPKCRCEFVSV